MNTPKTYCRKCGDHAHDGPCSPTSLEAMRRNPMLALLIRPDGTLNTDAPIILGDGIKYPVEIL